MRQSGTTSNILLVCLLLVSSLLLCNSYAAAEETTSDKTQHVILDPTSTNAPIITTASTQASTNTATTATSTVLGAEDASTPVTSSNSIEQIALKNVTQQLTEAQNSEYRPDVALVILNWRRFPALKKIVNMVCSRKNVKFIKEIIIWNNNPNITVTYEHFPSCRNGNIGDDGTRIKPTVAIINSPANTRFVGRYYACLMAKSPVCLFQDDDVYVWQMRSLYSQFLRHPNNLHTITLSEVFHYESMYSFHNATLGVHSGFAMVGFGGIVKQSIIAQFLNTMTALKLSSNKISLFADVYLPILMNQHKYSISSQVSVIEQKHSFGTDAVAVDNTKELFWMMKTVLKNWDKTVELFNKKKRKQLSANPETPAEAENTDNKKKKKNRKALHTASPFLKLETTDWTPLPERNARSTCVSDECIFISNLNPFDYVYDQGFSLYGSKKRYAVAGNSTCRADTYFARAVDLNPQSSWKSSACHSHSWEKIVKRGKEDPYIGLDLLKNRLVTSVSLALNDDTDCVKTNAFKFFVARSEDINKATGNVEQWHPFTDFAADSTGAQTSIPVAEPQTYSKWVAKGAKPEHEDDDDEDEDEDEEEEKKPYDQVQVNYTVNTYKFNFAKPHEIRFIKLAMNKDDTVCSKALEVHELQAQFNKPQISMTKLLRELMKGKHVDVYEE